MNPYEKTANEIKRQSEGPKRFLKGAAALGATAASFSPIIARAAPFLSPYISEDMFMKGLSKINPKFGNFIKTAKDSGYDFDNIKDFIGTQVQESQNQAKQEENIIQKYSPELHQFIDQEIRSGRPALHAAAIAQNDKRFSDVIKKLTKDYKTNWSNIVEGIYGNEQGLQDQSKAALQEEQPMQGQPGQQGDARSDLAQAMQQLAQMLQR